jgi:L-lactate dehydrogenase complex protein LldG
MAQASVEAAAGFAERAGRVGAEVLPVARGGEPAALLAVLRAVSAGSVAVAANVASRAPLLASVAEAGLRVVEPEDLWPDRRVDVGVSEALLGVIETGSLLLHSTSTDRRVELCADVHVVILDGDRLASTLDDALRLVREIAAWPPSYVSLVSGPSRSADIERTLAVGVHGPRALHVLLAGAA